MSDRLDRIEAYLEGKLSPPEKQNFEAEMAGDPSLQNEVEKMRTIHAALEVSIEEDLRAKLNALKKNESSQRSLPPRPRVRPLFVQLAAAAAILILISAGLWFLLGRGSDEYSRFTAEHYVGYDYTQVRGDFQQQRDFPSELFETKSDRQKAITWFVSWLNTHPGDDEARFVLADIYVKEGQHDKAKAQLAVIMTQNSILWKEKAEWDYILLSGRNSWDDLAKRTFDQILNSPSHSYYKQARQLEQLRKQ
ncbi:MAG TPA: hypothetical protein VJ508_20645 [Saprospiraceae bacterium]|nr:hypothetical protein [Saprospiraceae bacterium]